MKTRLYDVDAKPIESFDSLEDATLRAFHLAGEYVLKHDAMGYFSIRMLRTVTDMTNEVWIVDSVGRTVTWWVAEVSQ